MNKTTHPPADNCSQFSSQGYYAMNRMARVFAFVLIVAAVEGATSIVTTFLPAPVVPSPACDASNVLQDQQRHASDLSAWLQQSHFVYSGGIFLLAFAWPYLQVSHGLSAFSGIFTNAILGAVTVLSASLWIQSVALAWARRQFGTCLDETLHSAYKWDVSLLGRNLPMFRIGDWHWAVTLDALAYSFGAVLLGSFVYLLARRLSSI